MNWNNKIHKFFVLETLSLHWLFVLLGTDLSAFCGWSTSRGSTMTRSSDCDLKTWGFPVLLCFVSCIQGLMPTDFQREYVKGNTAQKQNTLSPICISWHCEGLSVLAHITFYVSSFIFSNSQAQRVHALGPTPTNPYTIGWRCLCACSDGAQGLFS